MRIIDFVAIFLLIYTSMTTSIELKAMKVNEEINYNQEYKMALASSVQDAADSLRINVNPSDELEYGSSKINPSNLDEAFEAFLRSLSMNFGVEGEISKNNLLHYIPVFSVVESDGLSLNVYKDFKNDEGYTERARIWLPRIPFSYSDPNGYILNFSIDEYVELYSPIENDWFEGSRSELSDDFPQVPLLKDEELFKNVRNESIITTIEENLEYYISQHNVYARSIGITYNFYFPRVKNSDWFNNIEDVSVLAFFQGYPKYLNDARFNEFALSGSRLEYSDRILAGQSGERKIFWNENCGFDYSVDEIFSSKKEAAKRGYQERSCLNLTQY